MTKICREVATARRRPSHLTVPLHFRGRIGPAKALLPVLLVQRLILSLAGLASVSDAQDGTALCYLDLDLDEEHTFRIMPPEGLFAASFSTYVEIPCCISQQDIAVRAEIQGPSAAATNWLAASEAAALLSDGKCGFHLEVSFGPDLEPAQLSVDLFPASARAVEWSRPPPRHCGELSLDCRSIRVAPVSVTAVLLEGLQSIEAWAGLTFLFTEHRLAESLYISAMPGKLTARFDGQLPSFEGLMSGMLWILVGPTSANVLSATIATQSPTAESREHSIPPQGAFFRVAWTRAGPSFPLDRISWARLDPPVARMQPEAKHPAAITVEMQARRSLNLLGTMSLIGVAKPVPFGAELTRCSPRTGMLLSRIGAQFFARLPENGVALAAAQLIASAGLLFFDVCVYLADRFNISSGWVMQDRVFFEPAGGMLLLNSLMWTGHHHLHFVPRMRPGYPLNRQPCKDGVAIRCMIPSTGGPQISSWSAMWCERRLLARYSGSAMDAMLGSLCQQARRVCQLAANMAAFIASCRRRSPHRAVGKCRARLNEKARERLQRSWPI